MENYIIANCTHPGKVRDVNEDSMVVFDSPNGRVVAVCDGMGGQNAGDVASQLAVAVIQDILTDNTFNTPEEAINRSIVAANQAILHKASQNAGYSGMGATCVMLIIKDGMVYYGSVGDSRIYYIANHMIRQLTKDQSYVQTLVDAGQLSAEAAEHHQDKNQITNALGVEGMTPPVIGTLPITPEPNSVFLLCSDGLSGMISNNAILKTVIRHELSLQERAQSLIKQANEAGGLDNITVQLVEFPANVSVAGRAGNPAVTYGGKKSGNKSQTMLYSLIVCLLLMIIGGGVYWYFDNSKQKDTPTIQQRPEKTVKKKTPSVKTNTVEKKTNTVIVETKTKTKEKAKSKSKNNTEIPPNLSNKGNQQKGDSEPDVSGKSKGSKDLELKFENLGKDKEPKGTESGNTDNKVPVL